MTHADEHEIAMPILLRMARDSYARSIRRHLAAGGFEDLPRNGPFVLGGMATNAGTAADMIAGLGVSKQAASQLIDTLVVRGYLEREVNPDDRRRITTTLTEAGRAAADAVRSGVQTVDAELAAHLSAEQIASLRSGLLALAGLAGHEHPHSHPGGHEPG
jgi:DNA-binding MarR family transcriptional regulator